VGIIEVRELKKVFNGNTAVDGVSFSVEAGEVFGLLGPNGAGKSTLISMISCLLDPTSGDALIDGHSVIKEPMEVKKILGVIPQEIALYPTLTARENLHFWSKMYGLSSQDAKKRADDVLKIAGLSDRADEKIETYSGGMKRRINIAAGLLHKPKVLLMDEPTVGIDPQSRNHILETVKSLNKSGLTVLYTSHYMEEVEFLCDRIAIVDQGKVMASGTQEELKKIVGQKDIVRIKASGMLDKAIDDVKRVDGIDGATVKDGEIDILTKDSRKVLAVIISILNQENVKMASVEVQEPDLEGVFLHLTGKSLRD
jgi:ABC-2 type transport system ATP-binding protein